MPTTKPVNVSRFHKADYIGWRAELLAAALVTSVTGLRAFRNATAGGHVFDIAAVKNGRDAFYGEIVGFSSFRATVESVATQPVLSGRVSGGAVRAAAEEIDVPVYAFLCDADSEHARWLRLGLPEQVAKIKGTGCVLEFPIENVLNLANAKRVLTGRAKAARPA